MNNQQKARAAKIWMYSMIAMTDGNDGTQTDFELREFARDLAKRKLNKIGVDEVMSEKEAVDLAKSK